MDPDDARRRKLLNILLMGAGVIAVLGIVVTTIAVPLGMAGAPQKVRSMYVAGVVTLVGVVVIFLINRYGPGWLASALFLLLLTLAGVTSDELRQVSEGRSLIVFAIPIAMASMLAKPWATFIMAGFSSLIIAFIQISLDDVPNFPGIFIFFLIALVSWLTASGLERALRDLRTLNLELDQRVEQQTGELRAILHSTADGIVVFDTNGKATIANPAIEHLLEQPSKEIVGRDIKGLMSDNVNAYDQEVIADILKDKTAHYPSLKVRWDDKTLSMNAAPVKLDSGEDIGTVAVFRDFTREAEIDRMKSTFLSIASHDLRSPLSAILGLTELVREGVYTSSEKQRYVIDRIYSNTQYMLSLANSLLGQAQIEAGILQLRLAPLSPSDLVKEVTGAMGVLAQDRGIELTGHVSDDMPASITGDHEKLNQVLFNLVGNAIKFTDKGSVQVRAYAQDEGHWALVVSDTGRGIPEDAQDLIFEPFRQVEGTSAAGVGLGLTIVKQLVDLMGSEIHLESQVGKGSTFTVVLPITPETQQQDEKQTS
ncbi:MAG: PAS domain S-box protein [Anaerolineae bacterium]|nr:PAS domain S-box protein [Anaerolineae bacterium]